MVVGKPPLIERGDLPLPLVEARHLAASDTLAELEKRHIADVLRRTGGNVTRAAQILGVDRVTVYNKIKKYGLPH
jgi:transcriptional regulator of acetoin/glycerol metabolism